MMNLIVSAYPNVFSIVSLDVKTQSPTWSATLLRIQNSWVHFRMLVAMKRKI